MPIRSASSARDPDRRAVLRKRKDRLGLTSLSAFPSPLPASLSYPWIHKKLSSRLSGNFLVSLPPFKSSAVKAPSAVNDDTSQRRRLDVQCRRPDDSPVGLYCALFVERVLLWSDPRRPTH